MSKHMMSFGPQTGASILVCTQKFPECSELFWKFCLHQLILLAWQLLCIQSTIIFGIKTKHESAKYVAWISMIQYLQNVGFPQCSQINSALNLHTNLKRYWEHFRGPLREPNYTFIKCFIWTSFKQHLMWNWQHHSYTGAFKGYKSTIPKDMMLTVKKQATT